MQSLIHDTNAALSLLQVQMDGIGKWLKENVKQMGSVEIKTSEMYVRNEYLRKVKDDLRAALDNYYIKFQNDFATP